MKLHTETFLPAGPVALLQVFDDPETRTGFTRDYEVVATLRDAPKTINLHFTVSNEVVQVMQRDDVILFATSRVASELRRATS